jgi:hypothetical protein
MFDLKKLTGQFQLEGRRYKTTPFPFLVRQAWRVARKRERSSCGGYFVDLAVQVRCRP